MKDNDFFFKYFLLFNGNNVVLVGLVLIKLTVRHPKFFGPKSISLPVGTVKVTTCINYLIYQLMIWQHGGQNSPAHLQRSGKDTDPLLEPLFLFTTLFTNE